MSRVRGGVGEPLLDRGGLGEPPRARGPRRRDARRAGWLLALAPIAALAASCVVGADEEPGCHSDAECGTGVCRAGACFAVGPGSTPVDPSLDAGDDGPDGGGDAAEDAVDDAVDDAQDAQDATDGA